jgi:predicted anti-sigma-YlaC factor YlaD
VQLPETNCARARESVSAQLDNELPDSEFARLEAHLLVCPDCSAWAEQARAATAQLRATRLEEPVERLVLPRRGRSWRVGSAVALVSAAAVVATMFVAPGHRTSLGSEQSTPLVSGYVGVAGRHYVISRLTRLEDGVFAPVNKPSTSFQHV